MNRFILLAIAVACSWASAAFAGDYLVRVDTMGYVDRPAAEKDPKETILRSIEVVARPGAVFHCKVRIGTHQTLTLTGKLRPVDKGNFVIEFQHVYTIDTGVTVPTEGGKRKPLLDTTTTQTMIAVPLDVPVVIGGLDIQSGKPKVKSRQRWVLRLTKYKSPDD